MRTTKTGRRRANILASDMTIRDEKREYGFMSRNEIEPDNDGVYYPSTHGNRAFFNLGEGARINRRGWNQTE